MDLTSLSATPPWEWPKEAHDLLTGVLRNRQGALSDRALAARLAGNLVVMDDRMADLLLSIVRNREEPEEVRARAAISLGPALEDADMTEYDDELDRPALSEPMFRRVRESLRGLYSDDGVPKEVRRRVLEASVRCPEGWHRDAIRAAYASDDQDRKLTAVFCTQWVRDFDRQILEALHSGNEDIQREAVRAAGRWQLEAAWPAVSRLIASEATEKYLLMSALEAAASIRPQEAMDVLERWVDSADEEIAEAAREAWDEAKLNLDMQEDEGDGEDLDEEDGDEDLPKGYIQ